MATKYNWVIPRDVTINYQLKINCSLNAFDAFKWESVVYRVKLSKSTLFVILL